MGTTDIDTHIQNMLKGDRRSTARLMTFIEQDSGLAQEIVQKIYRYTGKAYIIGLTGAPGVGKSTVTNTLIESYLAKGMKIGVIMVDPSSPFTGGAILGDRIRLKTNFSAERVFIRSMASRGQLGGIALATRDMVKVLDAYGCQIIIVETVGVGQSEVDIFKTADTVLVVLNPGAGDDIQAIKAGILEITDIYVVNKMDLPGADKVIVDIQNMLELNDKNRIMLDHDKDHNLIQDPAIKSAQSTTSSPEEVWRPPIVKTNAKTGENIPMLLAKIDAHKDYITQKHILDQRIRLRYKMEIYEIIKHKLMTEMDKYLNSEHMNLELNELIDKKQDPYSSAQHILKQKYRLSDE